MRQPFVILALFLTLPTLAEAGLRAQCRRACSQTVQACIALLAPDTPYARRFVRHECRATVRQTCLSFGTCACDGPPICDGLWGPCVGQQLGEGCP